MSQSLIERIKKARQTTVKVGDITLIVRRPTDLDMVTGGGKFTTLEILTRFVDGWQGMKECDLVPGGNPVEAPFSRELFTEWVADHTESWSAISAAVVESYKRHKDEVEEAAKN